MSTTTVSDAWIGATIKGLAGLKRVRLDQIAERLHINPSTLSNKLSGDRPWRAVEVAEAADILGVPRSRCRHDKAPAVVPYGDNDGGFILGAVGGADRGSPPRS